MTKPKRSNNSGDLTFEWSKIFKCDLSCEDMWTTTNREIIKHKKFHSKSSIENRIEIAQRQKGKKIFFSSASLIIEIHF